MSRIENLDIKLKVDKAQHDRVKDLLATILGNNTSVLDQDDTLTVTYHFQAKYLGNVEARFTAILELLTREPDALVNIDSNMLDDTTCLVARLVEKLRAVQQLIKARA